MKADIKIDKYALPNPDKTMSEELEETMVCPDCERPMKSKKSWGGELACYCLWDGKKPSNKQLMDMVDYPDLYEQKRAIVRERLGLPAAATAFYAYRWTMLFQTKTGSIHPLRVEYPKPVTKAFASKYAFAYLSAKDWLELLEDIYPTDEPSQNNDSNS